MLFKVFEHEIADIEFIISGDFYFNLCVDIQLAPRPPER